MGSESGSRLRTKVVTAIVAVTLLSASSVAAWADPFTPDVGVEKDGKGPPPDDGGGPKDPPADPQADPVPPERPSLLATIFPGGIANLDGSGNNRRHPEWGRANVLYSRVAAPVYADGIAAMVDGPSPRYVSNRVFNDIGQNVFSENQVTQWGFAWGQFLDHNFGLRETGGGESAPLPFDAEDPLEEFTNDLGVIDFARSAAAPGTGVVSPREQVNTVSSYIDAWAVYGGTPDRLEWLREGPVDGDLSNNRASLLTSATGYLPQVDARGNSALAPAMELMGRLMGTPDLAVVAGDVRANENIALTSVHTLFVREHNRIVQALPDHLSEEEKFQIARRVVMAEIQRITYREFLPALGVRLPRYRGYRPSVDATLSNEFAVVGYRAHSMIHGEIEGEAESVNYTPEELEALRAQGIEITEGGGDVEFAIPLNVAFGNPGLLEDVGIELILEGLGTESQYNNDEMIDNQLRSVLFQLPGPDTPDPSECLDGPPLPECFQIVLDLGALDIQRGRDHGMPSYNDLRVAYGLAPVRSFAALTGERTERFPSIPAIDAANPIDDPDILGFASLTDIDGVPVVPGSEEADEAAVFAVRQTPLAARLRAIYGRVDRLDAFVGMVAEPHVAGSELGELQRAIWARQFQALRDGDRFFYRNDPSLRIIRRLFGIDFRSTLSRLIVLNTGIERGEISRAVFTGSA